MKEFVIALDIGGTNTRAAIVSPEYKIQRCIIHPTVVGSLDNFLNSVSSIIKELCPSLEGCKAITAGVPGRVRWDGYIYALPNIGIESVPLAEYLKNEFNLPCYIRNDAEAAALAEAVAGPYKDAQSLFFVTVSTGVGAALTIDGKLRTSSYEHGHVLTEYKGELHEFEHMASGTGILKMCEMNNIRLSNTKEFFDFVERKDPLIMPIYNDWLNMLAEWIKTLNKYFSPEIFTFTGGVMKSSSIFWSDLKKLCPKIRLEKCFFSQDAGLIGAGVFGYQNINKD